MKPFLKMVSLGGYAEYHYGSETVPICQNGFIFKPEDVETEFKHTTIKKVAGAPILKAINAFLNGAKEGVISVGVADNGKIVGFGFGTKKQLDTIKTKIISTCSVKMTSKDSAFLSKIKISFEPVLTCKKMNVMFIINIRVTAATSRVYFSQNGAKDDAKVGESYTRSDGSSIKHTEIETMLISKKEYMAHLLERDTIIEKLMTKIGELESENNVLNDYIAQIIVKINPAKIVSCYNKKCEYKRMRKFEIVDFPKEGKKYGSYAANTPGQAASKAFSALVKKMKYDRDEKEKFIIFTIREQNGGNGGNGDNKARGARGLAKQTFTDGTSLRYEYVGTRVKLHKPIHLGNRTYHYRNIVVSHKDKYFD